MMSPVELESKYQEIMKNLATWAPEGIIEVDVELLQRLDLLKHLNSDKHHQKQPLTHYFHVIETNEKVTLFNEQFVIWIVPQLVNEEPVTFTFIALVSPQGLHVETIFASSGVYNTSKLVLQVVERTLDEIMENEELLSRLSGT